LSLALLSLALPLTVFVLGLLFLPGPPSLALSLLLAHGRTPSPSRLVAKRQANFPVFTYESALALVQVVVGVLVFFFAEPGLVAPYIMWSMASLTFTLSTVVWTAPVTMRNNLLRWALMMLQGKLLCGFGGETYYMVGTTSRAYMFHITAARAIRFGYVTREQAQRCGFSIVRNPYSRMVSMFHYNQRPFESFAHFCRAFHRDYRDIYVGRRSCECADIYCHVLPMHEYTHVDGVQVVACVIKQEHLKALVASDWEDSGVPDDIVRALDGIPHANRRSRKDAWQHYYTQETMDIVYDMYARDFELFGYSPLIEGRPDLVLRRRAPGHAAEDALTLNLDDAAASARVDDDDRGTDDADKDALTAPLADRHLDHEITAVDDIRLHASVFVLLPQDGASEAALS
jgi:hypothetical protein